MSMRAAEDALRQAIDLDPDQPQAVQHWIALRQKQCKWPVVAGWDGVDSRRLLSSISPLSTAVMFDDPVFQLARAASYARETIARPKRIAFDHTRRKGEQAAAPEDRLCLLRPPRTCRGLRHVGSGRAS